MKAKSGATRGIGSAAGGSVSTSRATPQPGRGGIASAPAAPVMQPVAPPIATPQPVSSEPINGVHPLMISSLPSIASGADIYSRQFYRGPKVPFRRYLPVMLK